MFFFSPTSWVSITRGPSGASWLPRYPWFSRPIWSTWSTWSTRWRELHQFRHSRLPAKWAKCFLHHVVRNTPEKIPNILTEHYYICFILLLKVIPLEDHQAPLDPLDLRAPLDEYLIWFPMLSMLTGRRSKESNKKTARVCRKDYPTI